MYDYKFVCLIYVARQEAQEQSGQQAQEQSGPWVYVSASAASPKSE